MNQAERNVAYDVRAVHVIGLGALGSVLFQSLFRKGVPEIHIWDTDTIIARNRFNQQVFAEDISTMKTDAMRRIAHMIDPKSTTEIIVHPKATEKSSLSGIVFACVDSMADRKQIWNAVRNNPTVSFFSDGRIGMDGGKVYAFDPCNVEHIARYEDPVHLHKDPPVPQGACKTEFPMPETAGLVAGHMLWRWNRWVEHEVGNPEPFMHFYGFCFIPGWGSDGILGYRRGSERTRSRPRRGSWSVRHVLGTRTDRA